MSSKLKGWHPGEAAIHSQLQYTSAVSDAFELITSSLPAEQRMAHSQLNFLPIVTLDRQGRPWVSILTSPTGSPGFVTSTTENSMSVEFTAWESDPICENLHEFQEERLTKTLIAGTAVKLDSVAARNKFSGFIKELHRNGSAWTIVLEVNQTIGNPSKYINIRTLDPHPKTSPAVEFRNTNLRSSERLPAEVVNFIHAADTSFFGTSYVAAKRDERLFPSHLGISNRGGNPGFLRVRPSDGRTIVFPDYSGRRFMNSLGNIEATPVASLTIPCFTSGDILYLTGTARNFVGKRAQSLMHRVNVVTTIKIAGYVFVRNALPIRQREATSVVRSPYSPPIRLLTEEKPNQTHYKDVSVEISRIVFKTEDIATFTFETSQEIRTKPGEWAMLDFSSLVGRPTHPQLTTVPKDMAREMNDDRIRTWSISSYHPAASCAFQITMKKKTDGVVTSHLFSIAQRLAASNLGTVIPPKGQFSGDIRLVSTGGDFVLTESNPKLLWIAGGIGITPFLSLLQAIQQGKSTYNISLLVAARLPDVYASLINSSLSRDAEQRGRLRITIHVYSSVAPAVQFPAGVEVRHHTERFERASLGTVVPDARERAVYICAPSTLSEVVFQGLIEIGADLQSVKTESFLW